MPLDLSQEFDAPPAPAPVDLAAEFDAPISHDRGPARIPLAQLLAGMGGQFQTATPDTTMQDVVDAAPGVLRTVARAAPTAMRIAGPMGAVAAGVALAPATGGLSIPASLALGAGGAAVAEAPAQATEIAMGQREDYSLAEGAINTAIGAVPGLRLPNRALAGGGTRLAQAALRGGEGAVVAAGQDTAVRAVRGEEITPGTVARAAGTGFAIGSIIGTSFDELARLNGRDRLFQAARAAGWTGRTEAELREWGARQAAARARPVTPAAPGASVPAAPRALPPPSARAEFEARAGMAPAAAGRSATPSADPGPIDYAPWETGGGMPATAEREDGAVEWARPPSPEAQAILAAGREPTTTLNPAAHPVVEFPVADIVVNKDVRQFKADGDQATGVVERLGGKYERLGTAPITLWQKLNGEVEVITGRHRLDLARSSGERTIPSQVVKERDGFTRAMALTFDAESNIRDGQGTIKDYAAYFRQNGNLGRDDAEARGLLSRYRGNSGWHLGRDAGDDLFALYANGQIAEAKAVAIARGAPGHLAAQASAIRQAARMPAGELELYARNLSRLAPDAGAQVTRQMGFEGISTDFAAYEEQAAKVAAAQNARLRTNGELIGAARGAAKNPGAAEKMGLPVSDPEALRARIAQLEAEQTRLRNPDAATWDELHQAAGLPPPPRPEPAPTAVDAPRETRPEMMTPTQWREHELARGVSWKMFEPGARNGGFDAQHRAVRESASIAAPLNAKAVEELGVALPEWYFRVGDMYLPGNATTKAVAASVVDKYGVTLPESYVREGDVFVEKTPAGVANLADEFELVAPTPEQLTAETERAREAELAAKQRDEIARRALAPLTGNSTDVGQGALFNEYVDLFSGPAAESATPAGGQMADAGPGAFRAKQPALGAAEADAALPPYNPDAPLLVRDGRRGAYWAVPLEKLADIPIVQMPELVHLVRELTGRMPEVRRLRKALGMFQGGGPVATIELDHRIFRDPTVAAKVLAHEIGHLADYLPDGTLARGNLLGRIASLLGYLKTSLPLDPKTGGAALTNKDRAAIRREAEKKVGSPPPKDEPDERAAWNEQVAIKYAEMVQDELETRGLIVERTVERGGTSVVGVSKSGVGIREELIGVSTYWKPIPEGAPDAYLAYRLSGPELYADALSVLLNSPGTLKRLAPTFYEAFFNYLDAKPESKKTLFDLYGLLSKPHLQVLQKRSDDIQAMFAKGDELLLRKAAEREARYNSMRGWWDRFRQELFDIFDPLVARGEKLERRRTKIPDRYNPRFLFDEHPLADNRNYEMVQRLWEKVVKPVEAAGYNLNELGEYLFLQRVLNERLIRSEPPASVVQVWRTLYAVAAKFTDPVRRAKATRELQEKLSEWDVSQNTGRTGVANPLGTTPETARLGLLRMRLESGPARFGELERAAKVFHDTVFEQMQAAVEVGAYSRELFEGRLVPNRDYYAAFGVLDYLEDYVPATIRMSQGTFKEIANPFTATLLKMVSVNRLIQTQKSKRGTVEFLRQFDPANITPAPTRYDGRRVVVEPPQDPDKASLELLDDGTPVGWHVDKSVAEMFDQLTPAHVSAALRVLNWPFRNVIYPLIIKYNPAFQLVLGPARDLRRTLVNVPRGKGIRQLGEFARNYVTFLGLPPTEAGAAVRAYLRGEPHDLIAEMIATQAIGTPLDNFARDFGRGDAMEKILADYGMAPDKVRPGVLASITAPVRSLLQAIEFAGLSFEMLPKVSVYKMLTRELGWSRKEAAYFVRNSIGVPNIKRKGKHTMVAEVIYPFTKVFLNGLRSDKRLATGPKTAGGWWLRWAASDGIWTMMQAAAALGLLGAGLKELYDGISDYNKTNYNVLPIGTTEGGEFGKRVVYIRLPRDETHRLVSGLLYQGMMLAGGEAGPKGTSSVLAFGADQVPGLNPLIEIGLGWKAFLEGENPKDSFRGSPVLTNAEWLAGGWPATKSMMAFTADNMGLTNFVRWDANANTTTEMVLSAAPGLNRFLQTTATGYRERQLAAQQKESAERARLRLSMPDNVQRLVGEYYHLRSVPAELRTIQQTTRMLELAHWHKSIYQDYEDLISVNGKDTVVMRQLEEQSATYERGR